MDKCCAHSLGEERLVVYKIDQIERLVQSAWSRKDIHDLLKVYDYDLDLLTVKIVNEGVTPYTPEGVKKAPEEANPWKKAAEQPLVQESLKAVREYREKSGRQPRKIKLAAYTEQKDDPKTEKKNPWKEAIEQPLVQESLKAVEDYKKKRDGEEPREDLFCFIDELVEILESRYAEGRSPVAMETRKALKKLRKKMDKV